MPVGAGDLGGDENDGDVPPLSPICLWWPRTPARVRFVVESARTADAGVVWSGVLQHPTSVQYEHTHNLINARRLSRKGYYR